MRKDPVKTKQSPHKGKRKLDYVPSKIKSSVKLPLVGKTVYLDVKETKHKKRLQHDLKRLGGTIEEFLSKDINYLITCQQRPRQRKDGDGDGYTPVPSPFNCDPSPSPGNTDDRKAPSVTRGKALAEKARVKARETNSLVDNAEKWGVKIVSLEGAYKWIDKELKKLPTQVLSKKSHKHGCVAKYKNFKAPFLKLEMSNFCYRPLHHELEVWPRLNVDTPRGSCPFDGTIIKGGDHSNEERGELLAAQVDIQSEETPKEEKDGLSYDSNNSKISQGKSGKKSEQDSVTTNRILTAGEIRRQKDIKRKLERKRGYCECCQMKYEDLDKHVREDQHRAYIKDKCHYEKLDQVINAGPNTVTFISRCLSTAVSMRNPKPLTAREEEILLIGSSPLQPGSPNKANTKEPDQNRQKRTPKKSKDKKDTEKKDMIKDKTKRETPTNKQEKNLLEHRDKTSNTKNQINKKQNKISDEQKNGIPESKQQKTPTKIKDKKDIVRKENNKNVSNVLKEKTNNSLNSPGKVKQDTGACKRVSPRQCGKSGDKKHLEKHDSPRKSPRKHIVQKENGLAQNVAKCIKGSEESVKSPRSGKCLSALFDREIRKKSQTEKCTQPDHHDGQINSDQTEANTSEMEDMKIDMIDTFEKSSASRNISKKRKDGERDCDENNETSKINEKINSGSKNHNKSNLDRVSDKVSSAKCDMKAINDENVTDAETCYNVKDKKSRTEKRMLKDEKEKKLIVYNVKSQDKRSKKKKVQKENADGQNSKETDHKVKDNKKSVDDKETASCSPMMNKFTTEQPVRTTVVDDYSDIQSDKLNSLDPGLLIFTKTLAERIKERSRSRPPSETSFNQSFNSSNMECLSKKKSKQKNISHVSSKLHKSRVNIASQKVLNKYKAQRESARRNENTQAGYEGDDEMKTKDNKKSKRYFNKSKSSEDKDEQTVKRAERKKFWYYEAVTDEGATTDGSVASAQSRPTRNSSKLRCQDEEVSDVESVGATGHIRKGNEKGVDEFVKPQKKTNKFNKQNKRDPTISYENELSSDVSNTEAGGVKKKTNRSKRFWFYETVPSQEIKQSDTEQELDSDASKSSKLKSSKKSRSSKFWYYEPEPTTARDDDIKGKNSEGKSPQDSQQDSDTAGTKQPAASNKPKSKKFWFYTTEPINNDDSMNEDVEILPSKLRQLNRQRNVQNIDSIQGVESDTNRQSDSEKCKKVKTTQKSKAQKFCVYTTEPVKDGNITDDVEILTSKLRRVNGRRDSQNIESGQDQESDAAKQSDSKTAKKGKSKKFWFYTNEEEKNEKTFNDVEILPSKLRNCNGRKVSQNIESGQDQESDNYSESASKQSEPVKRGKSKKFWFYTTEVIENENTFDNVEILPSKLRNCNGRKDSLKIESGQDQESESKQSDTDSCNEITKKSKSRKFWYYTTEPVNEEVNLVDEVEILPVKLRHLKGQRDSSVSDTEIKRNVRLSCLSNSQTHSKIETKPENKCSVKRPAAIKDSLKSEMKSNERKVKRSSKECNVANSKVENSTENLRGCSNSEKNEQMSKEERVACKQNKLKKSDKHGGKKRSESSKFWTYESFVEPESDEPDTTLPKELQMLKSVWNDFSDTKNSNKSRRSRDCTTNINYNETDIGFNEKVDKASNNISENKGGKKRSESSKFWSYESVVEPESEEPDTTLPKELQMLKSVWNDLSDTNNTKSRRSRDCTTNINYNENNIAIDEECVETCNKISYSEKCRNSKDTESDITNIKCNKTNKTSANESNIKHSRNHDNCYVTDVKTNIGQKTVEENIKTSKERRRRKREKREKKARALANIESNEKLCESNKVVQGSCSPTFNKTSSCSQDRQEKRRDKRAGSPVFAISPPSKRHKTGEQVSQTHPEPVKQHETAAVDTQDHHHPSIECISPIKNTSTARNSVNRGATTPVKTPDRKIRISTPASGYSSTSREVRRKQWKRKKENLLSSGLNSDGSSPVMEKKKRKLEKLKYKLAEEVDSESSVCKSPVNRETKIDSEKYKNVANLEKDTNCVQNSPLVKPLSWYPSSANKPSGQTVKLDKSWNLLSERSVTKLLSSEGDQGNFEGFSKEEVNKSLRSDLSYEECSEVSLESDSEHEWVMEETKGAKHEEKVEEFDKFVPLPFSSPGKRSDSSWLDACEDYIDKSLQKDNKDSSLYLSFVTSPWRSPIKKSNAAAHGSHASSTPNKQSVTPKKNHDTSVKRVDQEIEFNFGSPQKLRGGFSPLRCKNGKVIDTSSQDSKYSQKSIQNGHCKKQLGNKFSGLVFVGEEDNSESDSKQKQFRLLKKVSSNKKIYNIHYEKSPVKVKKIKKISV